MPKIDLNPLQSGGEADLTSTDGYLKMVMAVVSFAVFFALAAVGQQGANWLLSTVSSLTGRDAGGQGGNSIEVV